MAENTPFGICRAYGPCGPSRAAVTGGETYPPSGTPSPSRAARNAAPMPPLASLHTHSWYSLLEGVSAPEALLVRAAACGYSALVLTDSNNL